jgi:ankyrin repeat protein
MSIQLKQDPLQQALFQAAKVGHIQLMRELIIAGANFFAIDEENHTVLSYAYQADPEGTYCLNHKPQIRSNKMKIRNIMKNWHKSSSRMKL